MNERVDVQAIDALPPDECHDDECGGTLCSVGDRSDGSAVLWLLPLLGFARRHSTRTSRSIIAAKSRR